MTARVPNAAASRPAPPDDWVSRIKAGDSAAFEEMYVAYYRPLFAFIVGYVKSVDIAEELVQDVLCRVWERRDVLEIRGDLARYLFASARNGAFNYLTRQHIARAWESDATVGGTPSGMGQGVGATDDRVRTQEFAGAITRALDSLPPRCRQAFLLRAQQNLTNVQIAQAMHVSVKCVEAQVAKALRTLRSELRHFF